jgi:hypothetical protein
MDDLAARWPELVAVLENGDAYYRLSSSVVPSHPSARRVLPRRKSSAKAAQSVRSGVRRTTRRSTRRSRVRVVRGR